MIPKPWESLASQEVHFRTLSWFIFLGSAISLFAVFQNVLTQNASLNATPSDSDLPGIANLKWHTFSSELARQS